MFVDRLLNKIYNEHKNELEKRTENGRVVLYYTDYTDIDYPIYYKIKLERL